MDAVANECGSFFDLFLQNLDPNEVQHQLAQFGIPFSSGLFQITYGDCVAACNDHILFNRWSSVSVTATTWAFPVLGLLATAPFASNDTTGTLLLSARWLGSPICALMQLTLSMHMTRRCAAIIKKTRAANRRRAGGGIETGSTRADDAEAEEDLRDSMYILGALNQVELHPGIPKNVTESVIRVALSASRIGSGSDSLDLRGMRRELARLMRKYRRKGTVPIFINIFLFLFALGIAISDAIQGSGPEGAGLSFGILVSWLPTLVLACIVDRNPYSTEFLLEEINELLSSTRTSLLAYIDRHSDISRLIGGQIQQRNPARKIELPKLGRALRRNETAWQSPAHRYAGQARVRWHYGCALRTLEIIDWDTLFRSRCANTLLVETNLESLLPSASGLGQRCSSARKVSEFNWKASLATISALIAVLTPATGTVVFSYLRQPVGIGCVSGGFIIYALVALTLFIVEFVTLGLVSMQDSDRGSLTPEHKKEEEQTGQVTIYGNLRLPKDKAEQTETTSRTSLEGDLSEAEKQVCKETINTLDEARKSSDDEEIEREEQHFEGRVDVTADCTRSNTNAIPVKLPIAENDDKISAAQSSQTCLDRVRFMACTYFSTFSRLLRNIRPTTKALKRNVARYFLTPFECLNALWLLVLLAARTFGLWNSCGCWFRIWDTARPGWQWGSMNFRLPASIASGMSTGLGGGNEGLQGTSNAYPEYGDNSWSTPMLVGAVLPIIIMFSALGYITWQWTQQGPLTSEMPRRRC